MTDYNPQQVKVIPFFAPPTRLPAGWWRFQWKVGHHSGRNNALSALHLVQPSGEGDLSLIVALIQISNSELRLEALSRNSQMESPEIGYVSVLLHELQHLLGDLIVDGRTDHPVLKASNARARSS